MLLWKEMKQNSALSQVRSNFAETEAHVLNMLTLQGLCSCMLCSRSACGVESMLGSYSGD